VETHDNDTIGADEEKLTEQRSRLFKLVRWWRFREAAELAATLSDDELFHAPTEYMAHRLRRRNPQLARRFYELAIRYHVEEGRQATGSGEGLMAMDAVARLRRKLDRLRAQ
jgi:hypothetical protein